MIDLTNVMGGGGYAVSSLDLSLAIEPKLARILPQADENGGLRAICELATNGMEMTPEALIRRIYDARTGKSRTMRAGLAEAFTQGLGDYRLDDLDIPTMPRSVRAAAEMVEAWVDVFKVEEPELDARRLANKLYRFACGYVHSFEDVDALIEAEAWELHDQEEPDQAAVAELVAA